MRACPECLGDKVVQEPCPQCQGRGFLRKKHLFRKGVKLVNCKSCNWGAITKTCPRCHGLGQVR